MSGALPPQFGDLEPLVADWALPDFEARMLGRHGSDIAELRAFYEVVAPRFDDMLAALEGHPIDRLPEPEAALFRLLMTLAHVSHAVERHGSALPAGTAFPHSMRLVSGPQPA